jgi:hypothetical protein
VLTSAVILAFPSGRIEGVATKVILAVSVIFNVVGTTVLAVSDPQAGPGFSISGCRAACPANVLAIWSKPAWLPTFNDVYGALVVAVPIATAGVLVWRFITGTPPPSSAVDWRRSRAVLACRQHRFVFFLTRTASRTALRPRAQWAAMDGCGCSFVWYGFLFALIAAGCLRVGR